MPSRSTAGRAAMDDFLLRALLAGIGVALAAGPLGAFVVWRRMAYFGDTLAHAGLLGVALGLLIGVAPAPAILAVAALVALVLAALQGERRLASDTMLGILSHGALSIGVVALAFVQGVRVDLSAYLFGDILAVGPADLAWIWGGGAAVLAVLAALWRPLLSLTLDEDLAGAEGVPVAAVRTAFLLMIALIVALAMKIVGILLITALLVVPAATARRFASTPEGMAGIAAGLGAVGVVAGLAGSFAWDTPAGPSIVVAAVALFAVTLPFRRI